MSKLFKIDQLDNQHFSFEENMLSSEISNMNIDNTFDKIDIAIESLSTIHKLTTLLEKSKDNPLAKEALSLTIENLYNNLGVKYSTTKFDMEGLKNNTISTEGLTNMVGVIVKKLIDLVAGVHDIVEIGFNNSVRGLNSIKKDVNNVKYLAESITKKTRPGFVNKKIFETFQTEGGVELTPDRVLDILGNHFEVADSVKDFRQTLSDLVESDIDRVNQVFRKAKTGEEVDEESVFGASAIKMKKLVDLACKNDSILLGERSSIMIEIDEEALNSYVFHRATIQLTMKKHINAFKANGALLANNNEALKIVEMLEKLSAKMSNMTDFYMTFAHTYSAKVKNHLLSMLTAILSIIASATIGFLGSVPLAIISIVTWWKTIFYSIINFIKFFTTKFSNVTYRTMSAGVMYIKESAAS